MTVTRHLAKKSHEVAFQELIELLNRHPDITQVDLLAVAANMVGKIMALQDAKTMNVDRAMKIVKMNMELGNKQAFEAIYLEGSTPEGTG